MAPERRGRITMASMAAAEMRHYDLLLYTLERRGVDVVPAMTRYAAALDDYHRLTMPSTWLEALVKTYLGDAVAGDPYRRVADAPRGGATAAVREALPPTADATCGDAAGLAAVS